MGAVYMEGLVGDQQYKETIALAQASSSSYIK
jgi:hypothetical protein